MAGRGPSAAWCVGKAIEGAAADSEGRNPSRSFDFPFFWGGGLVYHVPYMVNAVVHIFYILINTTNVQLRMDPQGVYGLVRGTSCLHLQYKPFYSHVR